MHKDELLQLHSLLCQVKRFFADADLPDEEAFAEYEDLAVSPQHIHKSKTDHKRAVFLLGKGLSELVMGTDREHQERLRERFLRMADGRKGPAPTPPRDDAPEPEPNTEHLPPFALAALGGY